MSPLLCRLARIVMISVTALILGVSALLLWAIWRHPDFLAIASGCFVVLICIKLVRDLIPLERALRLSARSGGLSSDGPSS